MTTSQEKEELRKQLLEKRNGLSDSEFRETSDNIIARLQTLPEIRKSNTLHCYVSMNNRHEIDTHFFLRWMLASNKRVVVPITNFETTHLKHVELHSFEDLQPNKWGVLEPSEGKSVPPEHLDLVIVPMVGADLECNRIGYGKGFYDRFLSTVDCPTIGLCYEDCVVDHIPTESFDVQLSCVVTEERIIRKN